MSLEAANLRFERYDHVALIEMRRPPHNFFDEPMLAGIAAQIAVLDEDPDCRAVVLAAEGRSFCAGADFSKGAVDAAAVYRAALPIFRRKKPLIAAVQGPAVGGGLGLAVAADFRVASPAARFHANFVKIGLHPGFGLTETLPQLIGWHRAYRMLVEGKRIGAEEALGMSLVDRIAPEAKLRDEALALAHEIAEGAPLAVLSIHAALTDGLADIAEAAMARELAVQEKLFATADFREGVAAAAARRVPIFSAA